MSKKVMLLSFLDLLIAACVVIFLFSAFGNIIDMSSSIVRGSEFGMLIKLVGVMNKILAVLCLYVLRDWFIPTDCRLSKFIEFLKTIQVNIDKQANH